MIDIRIPIIVDKSTAAISRILSHDCTAIAHTASTTREKTNTTRKTTITALAISSSVTTPWRGSSQIHSSGSFNSIIESNGWD